MSQFFVNIKSWKKRRYFIPKTAFVVLTFCLLFMAYKPNGSRGSFSTSNSYEGSDSLYKGQNSEQKSFYQSSFQHRYLMELQDQDDNTEGSGSGEVGGSGGTENNDDKETKAETVALESCKKNQSYPDYPGEKMCKCIEKRDETPACEFNDTCAGNFPKDVFKDNQLANGAVILHIIGIMYMFYALALVCDEFFVPSLDVITEKLGITPDVAGATFMAAGGSAPELFTSIIGVFIAVSDVGIGTIVGSAVFNILFVIAACAFAAKEALELSAWPLIRDVFFYSISLILLVVFFNDNKIHWHEALILFLWYFAYVIFMKFSEKTEDKLRSLFNLDERKEGEGGCTLRKSVYRRGLFHLMNETIRPAKIGAGNIYDVELEPLNTKGKGGITGLKTQLQLDSTGEATANETQENGKDDSGNDPDAPKVINPAAVDSDGDKTTTVVINEENNTSDDPDSANDKSKKEEIEGEEKEKADEEAGDDEEDKEEPIDMSFPRGKDWKTILVYLISWPIMFPLYYTLPDTKKEKWRNYFAVTFLGSIFWIAGYSYLMVWWATVAGKVIGIPDTVMGLTFLAAGTSVPDLITSVLVAKQGKGDMAVSSSIGSNIFDVTVGLPVPWLIFAMVNGKAVEVSSAGVGCYISLLFLMLILVFLAILAFKWRMTKEMGIMMGCLYFVFVVVSVGFDFCWYTCPV